MSFNSHNFRDTCVLLNVTDYSMNTKPWTNHIDLGLYPPTSEYNYGILNYPKIFYLFPHSPKMVWNIVPSMTPSVNIYVTDKMLEEINFTELRGWMKTVATGSFTLLQGLTNIIFILITVTLTVSAHKPTTYTMYDVNICHACENDHNAGISKPLVFSKFSNSAFTSVRGNSNQQKRWVVANSGSHDFSDNAITNIIQNCEQLKTSSHTSIFFERDRQQQVEFGYAMVWISIMGNYSYDQGSERMCVNGQITPVMKFDIHDYFMMLFSTRYFQIISGGNLYPVDLPSLVDRLRFISCGKRGFRHLPFEEFVSIFDYRVWILTMVSLVAAALSISGVVSGHIYTFPGNLLACAKVLLEQGNPFPNFVAKIPILRLIIAADLLVGVVISNCYKSTNVYNMITEREPLRYEKFMELVKDNFTIYTRAAQLGLYIRNNTAIPDEFNFTLPHFVATVSYSEGTELSAHVGIVSEMAMLNYSIGNAKPHISSDRTWSELRTYSRLHPELITSFTKIFPNVISAYLEKALNRSRTIQNQIGLKLKSLLVEAEAKLIYHSLKKCKRTAAIVPEFNCKVLKRKLRSGQRHVFIGSEIYYSNVAVAFQLWGWVPWYILTRNKAIQSSGIWEW